MIVDFTENSINFSDDYKACCYLEFAHKKASHEARLFLNGGSNKT